MGKTPMAGSHHSNLALIQKTGQVNPCGYTAGLRVNDGDAVSLPKVGINSAFNIFKFIEPAHRSAGVIYLDTAGLAKGSRI